MREIISNISGILLSISFSIAYMPQIRKILSNKSSKDISLGMLIWNSIGCISGLVYLHSVGIAEFWVTLNYIICLVMVTITILLTISNR